MPKAKTTVNTFPQLLKAYGGVTGMAAAFKTTPECIKQWKRWGEAGHCTVPPALYLGLFLGLEARGYVMSPKLVGMKQMSDLRGV